jgi:hypothetical protein
MSGTFVFQTMTFAARIRAGFNESGAIQAGIHFAS